MATVNTTPVAGLDIDADLEPADPDDNGIFFLLNDSILGWGVNFGVLPKGICCAKCGVDDCVYVEYVCMVPEVKKEILRKIKEGWNLPDLYLK